MDGRPVTRAPFFQGGVSASRTPRIQNVVRHWRRIDSRILIEALTAPMELKPWRQIRRPIPVALEAGRGEVWKARDTRLDRHVALKVSKAEFTARFDREARAIAAFNHPNICTLYNVGPNYLVMEWIDGVPLTGPLPVEKAVAHAGSGIDLGGAAQLGRF
jgi:hypothetical protein